MFRKKDASPMNRQCFVDVRSTEPWRNGARADGVTDPLNRVSFVKHDVDYGFVSGASSTSVG